MADRAGRRLTAGRAAALRRPRHWQRGDRPVAGRRAGHAPSAAGRRGVAHRRVDATPLDVARANLAGIGRGASTVRFAHGSWFDALPDELRGRLDVVVANPPYVADGDPARRATSCATWEPHAALFAGADGLDAHPRHRRRRAVVAGARRMAGAGDRRRSGHGRRRRCWRAAGLPTSTCDPMPPATTASLVARRIAAGAHGRGSLRRSGRRAGRGATPPRGRARGRRRPPRGPRRTATGAARCWRPASRCRRAARRPCRRPVAARTLAIAWPTYWSNENVSLSQPLSTLISRIASISSKLMCRSATITSSSSSITAWCSRSAVACTDTWL